MLEMVLDGTFQQTYQRGLLGKVLLSKIYEVMREGYLVKFHKIKIYKLSRTRYISDS